ncbi:MAG: hypothetical protein V7741_00860 [Hyphomonas sp.]
MTKPNGETFACPDRDGHGREKDDAGVDALPFAPFQASERDDEQGGQMLPSMLANGDAPVFAANATKGPFLGFGASGGGETGVLTPEYQGVSEWLTGGSFGLEESVPGYICALPQTVVL